MKKLKSKKLIYTLLFAGFAFILFRENTKLTSSLNTLETLDTSETESSNAKNGKATGADSLNSANTTSPVTISEDGTNSQTENASSQFADWFKSEAQLLDKNDPSNLDKENTLKLRAAQFSTNEIQYLKKAAIDLRVSANERITAVYFLTIASEAALSSLFDVAAAPYTLQNPQPAHSLGESTLMQEKAIRVVAIDELFIRYQNNAITRSELESGIQRISDPGLKQYAVNRLLELK